jgi:hypothetical protein
MRFLKYVSIWEADSRYDTKKFRQHFMEPEYSSPCSQEPSTGPCPQPDETTTSYHPIIFL